jgi:hypothetical protein
MHDDMLTYVCGVALVDHAAQSYCNSAYTFCAMPPLHVAVTHNLAQPALVILGEYTILKSNKAATC